MSALALHVRLHDGRYHGERDWPPSPARLFQALVAGVGLGGPLGNADRKALEWIEKQDPPLIAAPTGWRPRRGVLFYMPNNDSDRIGGDPLRMAKIRTGKKVFRPRFFDAAVPFVYVWPLADAGGDDQNARAICSLAERLYQLGRGIDMAWAWGEILDNREIEELLSKHPGRVFRPLPGSGTTVLTCPCPGSLESIERRHRAFGERFRYEQHGRSQKAIFRQPPQARFRAVSYESPFSCHLYELRDPAIEGRLARWPLARASALVTCLRDGARERLIRVLSGQRATIERVLVGRKPDGTNDGPTEDRVRIVPLPSIGHVHADREIRRVLVDVPPTCPLRPDDVRWAFSGLDLVDSETGEVRAVCTPVDDSGFLRHYGLDGDARHHVWRTVTPIAVPEATPRRRTDRGRQDQEPKTGRERAQEQARVASAVCQALRHARVRASVRTVRVQREPFESNGARVEAFAGKTRFAKERLWHVELRLQAPVRGPLVIGDGRFLGLGVMAPLTMTTGIHLLAIESGLTGAGQPEHIARALRRAVMARAQAVLDAEPLPTFFSGHELDGRPARTEDGSHLAFAFDPLHSRLVVVAPHVLERRQPTRDERNHLAVLDKALEGMDVLRAGPGGCLTLRRTWINLDEDAMTVPSRTWESVTPYVVTRHARLGDAAEALRADVMAECRRRRLPVPSAVGVLDAEGIPGVGLSGRVRLEFATAVRGPVLLGRKRYMGGGLFLATRVITATPQHAAEGAPHGH